jgi:hypothetical protein
MGARAADPEFCCMEAAMNTTICNHKRLPATTTAAAAVLAARVLIAQKRFDGSA